MAVFRNFLSGVRSMFRKESVEREMDQELHAYLQSATQEKMRRGMRHDQARRAAQIEVHKAAAHIVEHQERGALMLVQRGFHGQSDQSWRTRRDALAACESRASGRHATIPLLCWREYYPGKTRK